MHVVESFEEGKFNKCVMVLIFTKGFLPAILLSKPIDNTASRKCIVKALTRMEVD